MATERPSPVARGRRVRVSRNHLLAVAAFWGALACQSDRDPPAAGLVAEAPSENTDDPASVRIVELWHMDLAGVGDVGGLATWDDGTIWIGSRRSEAIWEAYPGGTNLRQVRGDSTVPYRPGSTLRMEPMPSGGMLVLSRNGTTYFSGRDVQGDFREFHRSEVIGAAVFENGDYVVSHGQYPDDPAVEHAVHRYDRSGQHIASWHPAFPHDRWQVVVAFSGGPLAVTQDGDLLFSERAPFRITRYFGGTGDSSAVVVEDEVILSSSEMDRSPRPDGTYHLRWSRSVFLDEMDDGTILNVIEQTVPRSRARRSLWVAVTPDGQVLARTRFDKAYRHISPSGPGRYLAFTGDDWIVALQVSVE